jgi:hypothetical protein
MLPPEVARGIAEGVCRLRPHTHAPVQGRA